MALAIDGSTPAVATQTNAATTTVSQTVTNPPNGALLYIRWSWNSQTGTDPTQPTITDNLGTPLAYTLIDWSHRGDGPTTDGQAADWWAVSNGSTLTITVTAGVSGSNNGGALSVTVLTGADTTTPIGAHGKSGSTSAASIAQNYTAQATGGWGFIADCDWDLKGAQTAGTGCTLSGGADGSADVGTLITYGFVRRSLADDSNGASNTLNVTLPATSTNLRWVYAEVLPSAGAAAPADGYQSAAFHPGRGPTRARFWKSPLSADPAVAANVAAENASASADAFDANVAITVNAEAAAAAVTGQDPTPTVAPAAENAAVAAASLDPNTAITVNAEVASASAAANDAVAALGVNAENALVTFTANDATVSTAAVTNAPAECATATAAGQDATAAVAALDTGATASATANNSSVTITVLAQVATATAAALDATVTTGLLVDAGVASAAAAANDAVSAIAASVEAAFVAAVANDPTLDIVGQLLNATGDATVTTRSTSTDAVSAGQTSTSASTATASSTPRSSAKYSSTSTVTSPATSTATVIDDG